MLKRPYSGDLVSLTVWVVSSSLLSLLVLGAMLVNRVLVEFSYCILYTNSFITHTHTYTFSGSKSRPTLNVDHENGHSLTDVNPITHLEDPEKEKEKECQWVLPPGGKLTVPNSAWASADFRMAFQKLNGSAGLRRTCASDMLKMHRVYQVHIYVFKF